MEDKYYIELKNNFLDDEIYSRVKDYSKERHKIETYYTNGKILNEAGKHYGEDIIGKYSEKLMIEVGRKYDKSTLFRIRKFYLVFSDKKVAPLVPQLTWSHCLVLLPIKDINKINYYINQTSLRNLSKRQLQEIIKSNEYERLPEETKNKIITQEKSNITDYIKNPIIIRNTNNYEFISEKILQRIILEDIENFMKELGTSFCFIGSEYPIKLGNRYNYIDLLLYNIKYRCYVVIELKVIELKKKHIGQIEVYMNYIDQNIKSFDDNKTVGIIICKKDNHYVIEYCSNKNIITREYAIKKELDLV